MNIITLPISQLAPAGYNPRTINRHEFESLQRSIEEFGFVEPIVVNKRDGRHIVVGGHQRLNAAQALRMTEVPCYIVELDEAHEKALNIALNKIHGEWDDQLLVELLYSLEDDVRILTGFNDDEIQKLLDGGDEPKVKVVRYTIDELRPLAQAHSEVAVNFVDSLG